MTSVETVKKTYDLFAERRNRFYGVCAAWFCVVGALLYYPSIAVNQQYHAMMSKFAKGKVLDLFHRVTQTSDLCVYESTKATSVFLAHLSFNHSNDSYMQSFKQFVDNSAELRYSDISFKALEDNDIVKETPFDTVILSHKLFTLSAPEAQASIKAAIRHVGSGGTILLMDIGLPHNRPLLRWLVEKISSSIDAEVHINHDYREWLSGHSNLTIREVNYCCLGMYHFYSLVRK